MQNYYLLQSEFPEWVANAYASLITDYQFLVVRFEDWHIELQSNQCIIIFYFDYRDGGIDVRLKPARIEQVPTPRFGIPVAYDVYSVLHHLDLNYQIPFATQVDALAKGDEVEAARQHLKAILITYAKVIREACTPFLEGDFSIWAELSGLQRN